MNQHYYDLAHELQLWYFKAIELNLFLDTHPYEKKALQDFNEAAMKIHELEMEWEKKYGPLKNMGHSPSKYPWGWVEDPWPWELGY